MCRCARHDKAPAWAVMPRSCLPVKFTGRHPRFTSWRIAWILLDKGIILSQLRCQNRQNPLIRTNSISVMYTMVPAKRMYREGWSMDAWDRALDWDGAHPKEAAAFLTSQGIKGTLQTFRLMCCVASVSLGCMRQDG
jgi:hypothetical protein